MKTAFSALAALALFCIVESKSSVPEVNVYSRNPAVFGEKNTLICLVKKFHPPEITIELLEGTTSIANTTQTDLSFDKTWQFHLYKFADFVPDEAKQYSCRVKHVDKTSTYAWDRNM